MSSSSLGVANNKKMKGKKQKKYQTTYSDSEDSDQEKRAGAFTETSATY